MRIYLDKAGGCHIHGSNVELMKVAAAASALVSSTSHSTTVYGDTTGLPGPYVSLLHEIEFEVGDGPILTTVDHRSGLLKVKGSRENIAEYASHFLFPGNAEPGHHRHPEKDYDPRYISAASVPVTIEISAEE